MAAVIRTGALSLLAALIVPAGGACFDLLQCPEFADEEGGGPVVVTVRNDGPSLLYVTDVRDCEADAFRLLDADGGLLTHQLGVCAFTCAQVLDSACACDDACPENTVLRLEPGASYELASAGGWDGQIYEPHDLSLDCTGEGCKSSCFRRLVAPEGQYTVRMTATDACQNGDCDCEGGACIARGEVTGTAITAETVFELGDRAVTVSLR